MNKMITKAHLFCHAGVSYPELHEKGVIVVLNLKSNYSAWT